MENISKEEWKEKLKTDTNYVLLDVRTPAECAEGIQPNAKQIDFLNKSELDEGLAKLDATKTYYIYCRSGNRSGQTCAMLDTKGIKSYNLVGGMLAWDGEIVNI